MCSNNISHNLISEDFMLEYHNMQKKVVQKKKNYTPNEKLLRSSMEPLEIKIKIFIDLTTKLNAKIKTFTFFRTQFLKKCER